MALAATLVLSGCIRDRLLPAFVGKDGVRLEIAGVPQFVYEENGCQMAFNAEKREFRAHTDNMSDYFCVTLNAIPVQEGLLIVLSAVENPEETDPHFAHFHEEEGEESPLQGDALFQMPADQMPDIRHTVFRFEGIDEAVAFARRAGEYEGESRLYRGDEPHEFYMILMRPDGMKPEDFVTWMNQLVEYSDGIPGDPIFAAKLLEHDKPALSDAVNILRRM